MYIATANTLIHCCTLVLSSMGATKPIPSSTLMYANDCQGPHQDREQRQAQSWSLALPKGPPYQKPRVGICLSTSAQSTSLGIRIKLGFKVFLLKFETTIVSCSWRAWNQYYINHLNVKPKEQFPAFVILSAGSTQQYSSRDAHIKWTFDKTAAEELTAQKQSTH